ncbi:MAG: APC family permease [Gammaproteobacteria bacterium]
MTQTAASPSSTAATSVEDGRLSRGVLNTSDIVFMVMAAAAPMAVVVALMPMAFAFGNGGGVPGTYLGAIGAMLLFAVGYVRIIPFLPNAGAFYAYIAASIGRAWGLGAAYIAALSYLALSCSTIAALAFFAEQFYEKTTGGKLHWSLWAFGSIILTCWLSYYRITLAAKVLGIALIAEVALILLLDVAIVHQVGLRAFDLHDFSVDRVIAPGLGIAAIYAFNSMIGVEGTAIYQEEARNRRVTIPRATYIAVVLVGLFYVFTAWCLTSSAGAADVSAIARADPGSFIVLQSQSYLGKWGANAIGLLVITSSFAAVLALFNNSARYLYALGRDGVMPAMLARTHRTHHSPHIASFVLTVALVAVFVVAVLANLDPLVNVATALVGVGSLGLMALLGVTALAIPVFFAKRRTVSFATTVAPALGGLVILAATVLAFANYPALTGVNSAVINNLPYALIVIGAVGVLQALWLRKKRPLIYQRIGSTRIEE